ncbi:unnamed protein product, partial [Rotaria sp. Silwood1]
MTFQQSTYFHPMIINFAHEKFYEFAKKHIDALNPKFRDKAVITRVQSKKIINILQDKLSSGKVFRCFSHWFKQAFALRLIAGHQLLCDLKEVKPILLYEG